MSTSAARGILSLTTRRNGTCHLTYAAYNGEIARMYIAISTNPLNGTKSRTWYSQKDLSHGAESCTCTLGSLIRNISPYLVSSEIPFEGSQELYSVPSVPDWVHMGYVLNMTLGTERPLACLGIRLCSNSQWLSNSVLKAWFCYSPCLSGTSTTRDLILPSWRSERTCGNSLSWRSSICGLSLPSAIRERHAFRSSIVPP